MKGFKVPKMDAIPLFYYQQYIIFLLQKYLFCLFFNVENKVELMRVNERRFVLVS